MSVPGGLVTNDWHDVYNSIKLGVLGKQPIDIFIELRAAEFKFELRIMHERAVERVSPTHGLELRRARLNPGLRNTTTLI